MARCLLFVLIVIVSLNSQLNAKPAGPNVIVIMADDLGYGDVSCYGATELQTPNIDQLAKEGMRFTSGYCSASTCTPTRYTFLTGKYGFRQKGVGIAPPSAPAIIQPNTTTIASILRDAGYATAVVGKWHLGLGPQETGPDWNGDIKPGPLEIGFDYSFLLPTTNDRVPSVYVLNHRVLNLDPKDPLWVGRKRPGPDHPTGTDPKTRAKLKMDWSHGHNSTVHNGIGRIGFFSGGHAARWRDEDLADQWLERSNEWIENHVKQKNEKPFFLFFASHDCHVPRMPHERFHGKTKLGFRGDAIVQLDWCVGELIKTLKRLKLDNNTLVVFCSDNGPVLDDGYKDGAKEKLGKHKPAGPYRGGKYSIFEGGTRTPFITWLPGTIKPGVSDEIVTTTDLPACAAALTGQSLKGNECPDSFNVLDALLGKPGAKGRDHVISQDNRGGNLGYRHGDWKLLSFQNAKPMKRLTFEKKAGKYQLYNLASDPGERKNLFDKEPERARKMITELEKIRAANRTRP